MNKNTIHVGAKFKKITIEVEAEITEKGQVFIILPKDKFKLHRQNHERFMMTYTGDQK